MLVKVTEWPPIGKIAAHSAYDNYVFLEWESFPDLCLLVPFFIGV